MVTKLLSRCLLLLFFGYMVLMNRFSYSDCMVPTQLPSDSFQELWHGDLSNGLAGWGDVKFQFGIQNLRFQKNIDKQDVLRVIYPKGSYTPQVVFKGLAPMGGAQFTTNPVPSKLKVSQGVLLHYKVKFPSDFDFVLGGKLPGVFGGVPRSGGVIPNGRDGYSVRVVWRKSGYGAVYAYLPTSKVWGTLLGERAWQFVPGKIHDVALYVAPNSPGKDNGVVYLWFDGVQKVKETALHFRDVDSFNVDGIMFSTFFGGNTPDWATTADAYVDFWDFSLSTINAQYCH